jgi:hypothetical protein
MALKPCKECGKSVSGGAKSCPHCGVDWPAGRKTSVAAWGCLTLIVFAIIGLIAQSGGGGSGGPAQPASGRSPKPAADASPQPSSDTDVAWSVLPAAEEAVRSMLRDPESGKFGVINVYRYFGKDGKTTLMACGSINAKNGFGGYSGPMRFISVGSVEGTMMEEANKAQVFEGTWEGACKGEPLASQRAR